MMNNRYFTVSVCFLTIFLAGFSQKNVNNSLFISPLTITPDLSASYGDIRMNHFHYGVDYRTEGREGLPIIAVDGGYVSRIKIDETGYGRAIYIDHPSGYTSLYGHLSSLNPVISRYAAEKQYQKQSFIIDLHPEPGVLSIKKGDTIGFSGNSGGSTGPHLHFEIRDSKNQNALNVLSFGLGIKDTKNPVISAFYFYPTDSGLVNGGTNTVAYMAILKDSIYTLDKKDTIKVRGTLGFGISTSDYISSARKFSGIYAIKLFADNKLIYHHQLDQISFNDVRYINSVIDYDAFINRGLRIYRLFRQPGNRIDQFYRILDNNGYVTFSDNKYHKIECIVSDLSGHQARVLFYVHSSTGELPKKPEPKGIPVCWNKENFITEQSLKIHIPKNALYENMNLVIDTLPSHPGLYSKIYRVHTPSVPIHTSIMISIAAPTVPDSLQNKACLAAVDRKGGLSSYNGDWNLGMITARIRSFGDFAVAVDTIAPIIRPINIFNKSDLSKNHFILFKISDNLSGIQSYNGNIDGNWILFEHDPKKNNLIYYFDPSRLQYRQQHNLELIVTDNRGNKTIYKAEFYK